MSVGDAWGEQPLPASTPREIRAALVPEEVGRFDQEYRRAMADAMETLDLTEVLATLRRWRQIAVLSRDTAAHRRMLEHVDRLNAGSHVPTTPWPEAKTQLGL